MAPRVERNAAHVHAYMSEKDSWNGRLREMKRLRSIT